ncbi:selenium-binding protein SBP56-related protein [Nonomuraea typhae]|uniref:selenium-binding protein SBP56-related protein n=1 Tax=Nonomuraea typhae TaxID=2603600 RepID=UPI0012F773EA|nr:selenium-binding protein SBP56-related protein [Nonomuraea typhae]
MALWTPDPTFYPSPRDAAAGPPEKLAYIAAFDRKAEKPDAIAVLDTDSASATYGTLVGWTDLPNTGDELHHFGWNACSSALCPSAPHPHTERRYLVVPGLRSSRIHIFDTKDRVSPELVKVIEAEELAAKAGYSRPHTVHCGPDGLYVSALGGANGDDGPGGIAVLDHQSFEVRRRWEVERGPQYLAYDFWWHLNHDVLITSEWGTPSMIEDGLDGALLLNRKYGHRLHIWDLPKGRHVQEIDLGDEHQMPLELRPAHDPSQQYGFVGVVTSVADLSASVWVWFRDGERFAVRKVITIPAEPADAADLPPLLQPFGAVPPLVTDLDLSVDDRHLYVSCWGTGELKQYDVTDPFDPIEIGSLRIGGITGKKAHPAQPDRELRGGPQMVEISRDGKRVYLTNSLYGSWDDQFYPEGVGSWLALVNTDSFTFDERVFVTDFRGLRPHQVKLQGGDASSDSYCFP